MEEIGVIPADMIAIIIEVATCLVRNRSGKGRSSTSSLTLPARSSDHVLHSVRSVAPFVCCSVVLLL